MFTPFLLSILPLAAQGQAFRILHCDSLFHKSYVRVVWFSKAVSFYIRKTILSPLAISLLNWTILTALVTFPSGASTSSPSCRYFTLLIHLLYEWPHLEPSHRCTIVFALLFMISATSLFVVGHKTTVAFSEPIRYGYITDASTLIS